MNGVLYFSANVGTLGRELWRSDGTESGTTIVRDKIPIKAVPIHCLSRMWMALSFSLPRTSMVSVIFESELWKSDGTNAGTVLVKDILPGSGSSSPTSLTAVGDALFFTANNGTIGRELWISYGTEGNTAHVRDILPGSDGSNPMNLINIDGILYFAANDGINGVELWKSNGSVSGTTLARDIALGAGSSSPPNLRMVGDDIYLTANDGVHGAEPWIVKSGNPPTDIFLSTNYVVENSIVGTRIGTLTAVASTASATEFALVSGALDNSKFLLVGTELRTAEALTTRMSAITSSVSRRRVPALLYARSFSLRRCCQRI